MWDASCGEYIDGSHIRLLLPSRSRHFVTEAHSSLTATPSHYTHLHANKEADTYKNFVQPLTQSAMPTLIPQRAPPTRLSTPLLSCNIQASGSDPPLRYRAPIGSCTTEQLPCTYPTSAHGCGRTRTARIRRCEGARPDESVISFGATSAAMRAARRMRWDIGGPRLGWGHSSRVQMRMRMRCENGGMSAGFCMLC